jgi:predicted  nucleic acid-binding Zn-ribbon protein
MLRIRSDHAGHVQGLVAEASSTARAAQEQATVTHSEVAAVSSAALHAAPAADLEAVRSALAKLQSEVPSSRDLAEVTSQLATLEGGMAALDGLDKMRSDLAALSGVSSKLAALMESVDLSKEDILAARGEQERSREQLASTSALVGRLSARLDDLDGIASKFDAVSAQARPSLAVCVLHHLERFDVAAQTRLPRAALLSQRVFSALQIFSAITAVSLQVHKLTEDVESLRERQQAREGQEAHGSSEAAAATAALATVTQRLNTVDRELSQMQAVAHGALPSIAAANAIHVMMSNYCRFTDCARKHDLCQQVNRGFDVVFRCAQM